MLCEIGIENVCEVGIENETIPEEENKNKYSSNNNNVIEGIEFGIDLIEFGIKMSNKYEDDVDSYVYDEDLSFDTNDEWNIDKVIEDVAKEFIIIVDERETRLEEQLQYNNGTKEESSVGNMHEIRMLDLGSVLVEKETNALIGSPNTRMSIDINNDNVLVEKESDTLIDSTNTSMCIDINNNNGIKFEYNNNKENEVRMKKSEFMNHRDNNIKMNNLRWSKLNRDVKFKEVTSRDVKFKEVTSSYNILKVVRIYDG